MPEVYEKENADLDPGFIFEGNFLNNPAISQPGPVHRAKYPEQD